MKIKQVIAAVAMAFSAGAFAVPTDLGVLDANDTSFSKDFWRIFNWGSPLGAFSDYYSFQLTGASTATGGTLAFDWGGLDLTITSVSLNGGTLPATVVDDSPTSFAFSGLGAGSYMLGVNGMLKSTGPLGVAQYSGSIHAVAAPVPEPEHAAMMFAGLLGLGMFGARRARKS